MNTATFKVNLIEDRVMPRERRRRLFLGMLLYLLATGAVLAYVVFDATRDLAAVTRRQRRVGHLVRAFCEDHPGHREVERCAADLAARMTRQKVRLDFVGSVLARRWDLAPVLVGLVRALPHGVALSGVQAGTASDLSFEISVPVEQSAEGVDSKAFIAAWRQDSDLMSRVHNIAAVSSHRQTLNNRSVYVVRFSCQKLLRR